MAKSARNRHNAIRVWRKWQKELKLCQQKDRVQSLSIGKVFKQDPFDCGQSCLLCHHGKILRGGSRRQQLRRSERRALQDL